MPFWPSWCPPGHRLTIKIEHSALFFLSSPNFVHPCGSESKCCSLCLKVDQAHLHSHVSIFWLVHKKGVLVNVYINCSCVWQVKIETNILFLFAARGNYFISFNFKNFNNRYIYICVCVCAMNTFVLKQIADAVASFTVCWQILFTISLQFFFFPFTFPGSWRSGSLTSGRRL